MEKGALIGRGRTAEVFLWGEDRVLKLYEPHMPGFLVEQEYRLTRAAHEAGLPAPAADQLVDVEGRQGILFERLEGPSMLKMLAAQPWKLGVLARQLGELHAQIHGCLDTPGLPSQRQAIGKAIEAATDLPEDWKEKIRTRLEQMPEGSAFCHGDFHPDNVLLTARGPVVIDWVNAVRGNPLADVCRTVILFQTSGLPAGAPLHLRLLVGISRLFIERNYMSRYLQVHPASRQHIDAWELPVMAARLREVQDYPQEKQQLLARIRASLNA